jgi:hypothetical protein
MVARKLEKYLTRQFEQHVSRDSVEREQKYRVARVDTIRRRLLKFGAQVHASGFERNELYDCDDRLRRQDLKLRLRCHGGKIAMLGIPEKAPVSFSHGGERHGTIRATEPPGEGGLAGFYAVESYDQAIERPFPGYDSHMVGDGEKQRMGVFTYHLHRALTA